MSVNRPSTTWCHALWRMPGQRGDIKLWWNYQPLFNTKMTATASLLWLRNERQRSVNDICPCIIENGSVVWWYGPIIEQSANFLGKNATDKTGTMSQNECQRWINGVLTIVNLPSWIISRQWNSNNIHWTYWQPWLAKILVMILRPASTSEQPQSVNTLGG